MKRITTLTVMFIFISLFFANELFSQRGYWGRARGRTARGMDYGRMYKFQNVDTANINRPYARGSGRGYGRGGRGRGMGYGRMYNFQNINPNNINTAFVQSRGSGYRRGGWVQGTSYGRMYNPQTEETIKGKVVSVDRITSNQRMYCGIHLIVQTNKETIPVHLGPEWYLENQDMKIAVKDKVEIVGSRISYEGKPAIVAAEVKMSDKILILRDEIGIPFWSRGGWR